MSAARNPSKTNPLLESPNELRMEAKDSKSIKLEITLPALSTFPVSVVKTRVRWSNFCLMSFDAPAALRTNGSICLYASEVGSPHDSVGTNEGSGIVIALPLVASTGGLPETSAFHPLSLF